MFINALQEQHRC